jgi:orotidine-5'-phosphate decarboxylase
MSFLLKLETAIQKNNSLLCLGLDTDIEKLPNHLRQEQYPVLAFNKQIIDATHDLVCSYKFQIAYYSALGISGVEQLIESIAYIRGKYPEIPIILDAKRGDIGNTSEQYAKEAFDIYKADAVTVNPYLGHDGLEPFLRREDKGVIILCRTSNPGANDFQDLKIEGEQLYMKVADKIVEWNNLYGNCLMVVGATYPEEMGRIRKLAPDMFFLVPGIGAQGGDLKQTMAMGLRKDGSGLLIHSARGIIYASNETDFVERAKEEAVRLRDEINSYR